MTRDKKLARRRAATPPSIILFALVVAVTAHAM
jgi:hypothetical protein